MLCSTEGFANQAHTCNPTQCIRDQNRSVALISPLSLSQPNHLPAANKYPHLGLCVQPPQPLPRFRMIFVTYAVSVSISTGPGPVLLFGHNS